MDNLTPMMKQYKKIKERYKDSILFFRLGDFYEMFFDDAIIASKELEIALTQRDAGNNLKAPMCGVPYHVSDVYISKLVKKGYKVAICEQLEDPSTAKGLVERDVIRVVTPGTITDTNVLDEKSNNFLASIYMDSWGAGISYVDSSTGEMYTTEVLIKDERIIYDFVLDELGKISPSEIICNSDFLKNKKILKTIKNRINPYINSYDTKSIEEVDWEKNLLSHFKSNGLEDLGIEGKMYCIASAGKLIDYLYNTQKGSLNHISSLEYYDINEYMIMDINTRINLEIHETIMTREKKGALIWLLDKTSTAMGGRLLKNWLEQPLIHIDKIKKRQKFVQLFLEDIILMDKVKDCLKNIYDLERLAGKISYGNCNARDLYSLKISIGHIPELKSLLFNSDKKEFVELGMELDSLQDIYQLLDISIVDNPPITLKEGGLIKSGYNKDLDELKNISRTGKQLLTNLEIEEKEKTGIKNLRIGFNKISGYYFEVTKSYINLVPDYFIRKQTLTNSERYHTKELKELEAKILGAEDKIIEIEYNLFNQIREKVKMEIERIQGISKLISQIDVLNSLAQVAYENNYVMPKLNDKGIIKIIEGRHPVVEATLSNGYFVPNDTYMDNHDNKIQIITGPNMAGKSTYMRQVAIIILMAQIGSFIPAKEADICIIDRIFTRIGASDNLSQGESTFMVEMNEVANIIKNATKNSLIILDEVGRGTSTYDGLSIAWSVVEYIAENIGAKTLFATHYHELVDLENKLKGVKNLTILVEEKGDEIIFLRKIVEGSTNKSYGIQVAKLAGIDNKIIDRANEILQQIEKSNLSTPKSNVVQENKQLNFLDYKKDYFIDKVKNLNVNHLTPIEAINILFELVEEAKKLKERA
ncbi:DNA mismatch repair protein MutS [Tepidimicrobium xylanilyticum]|uniref:DNA mismatch repair protein MutS n=1 Tax=Tepidimicrobium xylanilyticum TaxID=1123352 RepID=A0A1H2Y7Q6_9FIRM|nr:DNA mismatch repair protein MutS [Tepidimicrobium xylanilyticum]GMG97061.1 DNA mismatch repair protein MutS [Tepidimicrobium xylanilyticum]SDX00694.1 DNA mismatch repair protein MutS [Tepidimicrobium xylanilyticum]